MPDSRPQLVAERYRLVGQIGEGGMGRVWKAYDELLARDVAVKELVPPAGVPEAELSSLRERVIREARAIAKLDHSNVVRIFDVIFHQGNPWIVMELVPSRSLFDAVSQDGPMAPEEAARVGLGVLAALRAAHRVGLLHRDVKPGNVLLAHDGRVVLTDFGLATADGDAGMTHTGVVIGSPQYLAPERALDGEIGPAADLWSLGATLYTAVEGRPPYVRSTPMATLTALATEPPAAPERAGVLRDVLTALLQRDPARRADAEIAQRLLTSAAGLNSPKTPAGSEPAFAALKPVSIQPAAAAVPAAAPLLDQPTQDAAVPTSDPLAPAATPLTAGPGAPASADTGVPALTASTTPAQIITTPAEPRGTPTATDPSATVESTPAEPRGTPTGSGMPATVESPLITGGPVTSGDARVIPGETSPRTRAGRRRMLALAGTVMTALVVAGLMAYPVVSGNPDGVQPQAAEAAVTASPSGVPEVAAAPAPSSAQGSTRPRSAGAVTPSRQRPSTSVSATTSVRATAAPATPATTTKVASPEATAVTGEQIQSMGVGTCLHAPSATGTVRLRTCDDSAGQRFTRPPDGTLRARGRCVQVDSTENGATLRLATCTGALAQQWDHNSSFDLVNLWAIKCVDIPDASSADGVVAQIWDCSGAAHQKWD